ncbi:471_t:CDS:2 [Funneliformis geosporum]|uniref:14842_t:CDS:1 n=1 Tax=Funneliformis geosporum TaxID=1117311 RepID=A0A9W4SNX8_9GLOM|nr:471_t:CDS:2 [Funneliformis geosporum]CAI2177215.1 14842_t:CDS:2 [Funneliformis geosporum]
MRTTSVISLCPITNTKLHKLTLHLLNENKLSKIPIEIIYVIMDMLNVNDLQHLSWTCRSMCHVARKYHFGIVSPMWEPAVISNFHEIPISNYRDGVWFNHVFYLPVFYKESSICWILDLTGKPIKWVQKPLKFKSTSKSRYEPIRHYAAAAIKNLIYIFGGENIYKGVTTNVFYELNVYTFELQILNENDENIPSPRMMHTLDAIDYHRLAMFGGRSSIFNDDKEFAFDSKDFAIYNTKTKNWTCYNNETPNIPYRRSLHSSFVMNEKLYIYGGQQSKYFSNSSQVHDDEDISVFDFNQDKWYKLLSPPDEGKSLSMLLPSDWIMTSCINRISKPGKRMCVAMFTMHNRIAILGGSKGVNWNNEEESRPWELMCFLSNAKHNWEHIRIRNLPQIEILTFYRDGWNILDGVFLIGRDKNEGNLIMGWVKDSTHFL